MKKEDFDKEVSDLFEEDSALAQAVLNIQERRERISSEESKTENNTDNTGNTANDAEQSTEAGDTAPTSTENIQSDDTSEENPDLSLTAAETLAVNPEDVIPSTDNIETLPEATQKTKKFGFFSKRKKTDITNAEPIRLMEFVANENAKNTEPAITHNEEIPSDDLVSDTADITQSIPADKETDKSEPAEIFPEADEETAIPESASESAAENTDVPLDSDAQPDYIAGTSGTSSNDGDSIFLTHFEAASLEIDEQNDEESETSDTDSDADESSDGTDTEDSADDTVPEERFTEEDLADTDSGSGKNEKSRFIDGVFDFLELFIFSLAAVLLVTTFFFRHSVVEGSSMEQTLFDGEHIIISNFMYTPERGDIVVCEDYSLSAERLHKPIVKRVIGIPGDTVKFVNNGIYGSEVYVNGEKLIEDYVFVDGIDYTRGDTWTVGEGEIFVMGDHRNNSSDSRDPEVGTIRTDSIIGKALIRFYPFEKFGKIE